jgi:hypothetical protein
MPYSEYLDAVGIGAEAIVDVVADAVEMQPPNPGSFRVVNRRADPGLLAEQSRPVPLPPACPEAHPGRRHPAGVRWAWPARFTPA